MWHSLQGTARWPPVSGNLEPWCFSIVKLVVLNVAPLWHCSQRLRHGSPANWPSCSSRWQSTQAANLILNFVAAPAGMWQAAQLTFACGKLSGKPVFAWSAIEKRRWAPALHRVAAFATAAIWTLRKLAAMRIGFMAVCAMLMWNRRLEISPRVAAQTLNVEMFPEQRETCFCVIERLGESRSLPRRRCMA